LTLLLLVVFIALSFGLVLHLRRSARSEGHPADPGVPLSPGQRVWITGGYDPEPAWLAGGKGHRGTIERFIPGNAQPSLVVRTDEGVSANDTTGDTLVLQLRYTGASWTSGAVVHVELCDFEPASEAWEDRRQGAWIESHAVVRVVDP
jgi:hypothetical protein